MKDVEIIGLIKTYVNATLIGMGALKGAPCQCEIATNADGTHTVTMKWIDNEGDAHTDDFTVLNGQVGDIEDLGDVVITSLADGQVIAWDSATSKWVNVSNSATVNSLNAVGDVTITSVSDGQVLAWDDTANKWVNTTLATVAKSGSYNDLSNKPSIPAAQIQSDWSQSDNTKADFIKNKPTLANVATSGDYDDLTNKPTIPAAQVQSDWNESDNTKADFIKNKPTLGTAAAKDSTNAITQNSTDLAESGAVYTGLAAKANKTALDNEVLSRSELGCHNLLPCARAIGSHGGGLITINNDYSVTINGTFSELTTFNFDYVTGYSDAILDVAQIKAEYLIASIADTATTGITMNVGYYTSDGTRTGITSVSTSEQFSYPATAVKSSCYLRIESGTYDNVDIYPMIRRATDADDTYYPYSKTNRQLTDEQGTITEAQYTAIQTLLT